MPTTVSDAAISWSEPYDTGHAIDPAARLFEVGRPWLTGSWACVSASWSVARLANEIVKNILIHPCLVHIVASMSGNQALTLLAGVRALSLPDDAGAFHAV